MRKKLTSQVARKEWRVYDRGQDQLPGHVFPSGIPDTELAHGRSLRIEPATLRGPVLLTNGFHGSCDKETTNRPTRLKYAFSCFHDTPGQARRQIFILGVRHTTSYRSWGWLQHLDQGTRPLFSNRVEFRRGVPGTRYARIAGSGDCDTAYRYTASRDPTVMTRTTSTSSRISYRIRQRPWRIR